MKCVLCDRGSLHLEKKTVQIFGRDVPHQFHWCDWCGVECGLSEDIRLNAEHAKIALKDRL